MRSLDFGLLNRISFFFGLPLPMGEGRGEGGPGTRFAPSPSLSPAGERSFGLESSCLALFAYLAV